MTAKRYVRGITRRSSGRAGKCLLFGDRLWRRAPQLVRWADLRGLSPVPPRAGLRRPVVQWRSVLRLVDAEFPPAWQRQPRDGSPPLLVDRRALHLLLLHLGDQRLDVVAHLEEFVYV